MAIKRYSPRSVAVLGALLLGMASAVVASAGTGGPNRAGLIIVHGDGQVVKACVEFSEDSISGLDLLQRSGLDLVVDATDPVGVAVCRIDAEGCTFPAEICFCQCQGFPCTYWSYWHSTSGADWRYSSTGPAGRLLRNGDSDGWVWGEGSTSGASSAPPVGFTDICPPPTATPTATDTSPPPTATATATETSPPPAHTPSPIMEADNPAPPDNTPASPAPADLPPTATAAETRPAGAAPQNSGAPTSTRARPEAAPSRPLLVQAGTAVVATPTPATMAQNGPTEATRLPESTTVTSPEPGIALTPTPAPPATPVHVAQAAPLPTVRPTRPGPAPTPFLAPRPVPASPEPSRADSGPKLLLAAGMALAAAAAGGVALLFVRRP
jgi:hypothetical protein